jgi:hypothetical protein
LNNQGIAKRGAILARFTGFSSLSDAWTRLTATIVRRSKIEVTKFFITWIACVKNTRKITVPSGCFQ